MNKMKKVAIVGSPNVGKSSIFNNLSSHYATVSNYPGTTVEIFKAKTNIGSKKIELIDTPGMYSFLPLSEEERIARLILIKDKPDLVLHVVSATALERNLPLTLQLIESGLEVVLVLNIMDEAKKEGLSIDIKKVEEFLGIPVVPTVSVASKGIKQLKSQIAISIKQSEEKPDKEIFSLVKYPKSLEITREKIANLLKGDYVLSKKIMSLLLLERDEEIMDIIKQKENLDTFKNIKQLQEKISKKVSQPVEYLANVALREKVKNIINKSVKEKQKKRSTSKIISDLTLQPKIGIPLLLVFLYFGIYQLVGVFGAGFLVDFLEADIFEKFVNPFFISLFEKFVPWELVRSLFVGEYGIITLGVRYAVAIILPIVGIFFFVFSFAEDTGYLPRVGAMLDRLFKRIGLSGKAVIPIVLGLGCDTMATMVTRILPTKRERIIATFLLSLSIPCSAQLGVIVAVLSETGLGLLIWFFTVFGVFTMSGFFLNKILKGKKPSFHIELPPLRLPRMKNIITKTYTRLKWYFMEVLPLFIWASVIIWLGKVTKVFGFVISLLEHPVKFIGLSSNLAEVFLFGFFRRDYGAAGLYDLEKQGLLSVRELIVSAVVLTLFLPCIAQLLMNIKERGKKISFAIVVFVFCFSFLVGFVLNKILLLFGMN
ncbi:MAG: ferrous iron transport protein B [Candidatus Omnitrophica bacterium]|nr:ferrous iron transport protein B [Candidatus Omnitrophota bacterium]